MCCWIHISLSLDDTIAQCSASGEGWDFKNRKTKCGGNCWNWEVFPRDRQISAIRKHFGWICGNFCSSALYVGVNECDAKWCSIRGSLCLNSVGQFNQFPIQRSPRVYRLRRHPQDCLLIELGKQSNSNSLLWAKWIGRSPRSSPWPRTTWDTNRSASKRSRVN